MCWVREINDAAIRRHSGLQRAFQAENQRAAGYRIVQNYQCPSSESFDNHMMPPFSDRSRAPHLAGNGEGFAIKTFRCWASFHRDSEKPARHWSTTNSGPSDTRSVVHMATTHRERQAVRRDPPRQRPRRRRFNKPFIAPD
jgi:hypothetical protein